MFRRNDVSLNPNLFKLMSRYALRHGKISMPQFSNFIELSDEFELRTKNTNSVHFNLNNADESNFASLISAHNPIYSAFPIVNLNNAAEINFVSPISSTPKLFHSTLPITNLSNV